MEAFESHNGAETMPVLPDIPLARQPRIPPLEGRGALHAILNEDIQALLDGERGIKDNEAKTEGEDVVTVADFQEVANGTLFDAALVKIWMCAGSPATS